MTLERQWFNFGIECENWLDSLLVEAENMCASLFSLKFIVNGIKANIPNNSDQLQDFVSKSLYWNMGSFLTHKYSCLFQNYDESNLVK